MNDEIGTTAGQVWSYLDKHGLTSIYQLRQQLKIQERLLHMALGWLAREGNLVWTRRGRSLYVELRERTS